MKYSDVINYDKLIETLHQYYAATETIDSFIPQWAETQRCDQVFYQDFLDVRKNLECARYDSEYAYIKSPHWAEDEYYRMPLAFVYSQEFRIAAEAACIASLEQIEMNKKLESKLDIKLKAKRKAQYEILKKEFG